MLQQLEPPSPCIESVPTPRALRAIGDEALVGSIDSVDHSHLWGLFDSIHIAIWTRWNPQTSYDWSTIAAGTRTELGRPHLSTTPGLH